MSEPDPWLIEPAKTSSAQAYERLRRGIIEGAFQAGERLTEAAVATRLGISRTPVRDAFARLAQDGLLRAGRGSGMEVVDPAEELLDILFIREAVEGCAARLAAMRASPAEVEEIRRLAAASRRLDPAQVEERARLNREFHLLIAAAARSPRVERLVSDYRELFSSPRTLKGYSPSETQQVLDDHVLIAEAIAAQDPDAAEAAIREHLRHAYALVLKGSAGHDETSGTGKA